MFDQDGDGTLSYDEFEFGLNFPWPSAEDATRGRAVFGFHEPRPAFDDADRNGDGFLDLDEMELLLTQEENFLLQSTAEAAYHNVTQQEGKCLTMSDNAASCRTEQLLSCASHIAIAENSCRPHGSNAVERCILSSDCSSMCACIRRAEDYALLPRSASEALVQDSLEKRLVPLVIGAVIVAGVGIAAQIDKLTSDIQLGNDLEMAELYSGYVWDKKTPQRPCSLSVFWSDSCGFINTRVSASCTPTGTR
ncbi:uncharacterized protein PFL1_06226 [Pseudozyma flocculosa PF-1]|uniref:EF-hand domain-containing protein n=1 Tax=Pseudozyma flocculosa PF-1 TaxID=1277687 RepID=A0A061H6R2_9BASI|nr:uncharacterized protein PFL1_06226 [Pseudozyma flocculosa PF-1]EPQ26291.1 hypothetical protein PFL1_06226 [Pseudozyma flocculosa PF-1]